MSGSLPRAFGPYALLKALGQGAMGDVHLARPFNPRRGIPTPVVIKRLHGELTADEAFIRRFRHEADIAVNVDSPHVAKVFDVGKVGDAFYIAMEFVAGWPLSKFLEAVLASKRHASVPSVIDLVDGGLRGLHALHSARDAKTGQPLGIVHRDISPKNLMVGEDGLMRLIDLGLGKSNIQDWKTRTGVVMGSVGYMPPEQVTADRVDHRADIYAMGVVLWEMLALRNFLKRGPVPTMLHASLAPEWTPPSKFRPDLPGALDEVIHKAVAHNAIDRYSSSAEFLASLREVVPEKKLSGPNPVSSLIRDLFKQELEQRRLELETLLSMPLPYPDDDGPEPEKTIVFAEAPGVAPLNPEEDLSPTTMQPYPAIEELQAMQAAAMAQPMGYGAPIGTMPPGVAPNAMVSSIHSGMVAPPRQGISPVAAALIAFGTLVLGAVGSKVLSNEPTVTAVEPVLLESSEIKASGTQPVERPPPNPVPSDPPPASAVGTATPPQDPAKDPPKHRAEKPDKPDRVEKPEDRPRPTERGQPKDPPPPVEASAETVKEAYDVLQREAKAALARLSEGSPAKAQIEGILGKAALEAYSTNFERAQQKLTEFRGDIRKIAP